MFTVFQSEALSNMDSFYDQQVPFGVPERVSHSFLLYLSL